MPSYYRKKELFEIVPLNIIEEYIKHSDRDDMKVLLAVAWLTGLRLIDCLKLTPLHFSINDVDKEVRISIKVSKHGDVAYPYFSFSDPFIPMILEYLKRFKPNERIFKLSKRRYQQLLLELNREIWGDDKSNYITFHYLRHSRISWLVSQDANVADIKAWTGHRSSAFEEYFKAYRTKKFAGKIR